MVYRLDHVAAGATVASGVFTACAAVAAATGAVPLALACGLLATIAVIIVAAAWELATDFQENNQGDGVYIHVDWIAAVNGPGYPYWAWMKPRNLRDEALSESVR